MTKYITIRLRKTILKARDAYERDVRHSNKFRACILDQATKWAAISEEEIGVARHAHGMNPRATPNQTGNIIPDAIWIARKAKAKEKVEIAAATKRVRSTQTKKKAAARKKDRENKMVAKQANESSSNKKMARAATDRNASWYKKMQGWGA